jgi:hypothetical protein
VENKSKEYLLLLLQSLDPPLACYVVFIITDSLNLLQCSVTKDIGRFKLYSTAALCTRLVSTDFKGERKEQLQHSKEII